MQVKIYGIKNCSTMKKAFDKLTALGIDYGFFDYKKQTLEKSVLQHWIDKQGIDKILNKKGTTWRNLTEEQKQQAEQNQDVAIDLMLEKPSIIKRPIIVKGDEILVGFDENKMVQKLK